MKKKEKKVEWDDGFYVLAYKMALEGHQDKDIAELIGISPKRFSGWVKIRRALKTALLEGRANGKRSTSKMEDYIYGRLTEEQQAIWEEIKDINGEPNSLIRLNRLFTKKGETVRKELFLYALFKSRFNSSQACRRLGISKATFDKWREEDLVFGKAVLEIEHHKGNYFESALVKLVDRGNPQAIMMANRTFNKDRGYADVQQVEHSGKIDHEHKSIMDISKLSFKLQQQILLELTAIEKKELENEEIGDLLEYTIDAK